MKCLFCNHDEKVHEKAPTKRVPRVGRYCHEPLCCCVDYRPPVEEEEELWGPPGGEVTKVSLNDFVPWCTLASDDDKR